MTTRLQYWSTPENKQLYRMPEGVSLNELPILFAVYRGPIFIAAFDTPGQAERYAYKRGECWIAVYVPEEA